MERALGHRRIVRAEDVFATNRGAEKIMRPDKKEVHDCRQIYSAGTRSKRCESTWIGKITPAMTTSNASPLIRLNSAAI